MDISICKKMKLPKTVKTLKYFDFKHIASKYFGLDPSGQDISAAIEIFQTQLVRISNPIHSNTSDSAGENI